MEPQLFERIYDSVVRREPTYDGVYYTAVLTTHIVCRPSCRARTPKAANVVFYGSLEEAIREGFRPCKRCRPEEGGVLRPDAVLAAQADAIMDGQFGSKLTLQSMAAELKVSPFHLQRTYKRVTGQSPAARLDALRAEEARRLLTETEAGMAEVAGAVGFRTPSHFAAWFVKKTGLTPTDYRMKHNEGGRPHEPKPE
ncbi:methylphosphotriester-DNA--protein-cysteine methyltransferase family protein [Paenibacillus tritici]|uniref:Methylphosphotriester-DNA--protein-cysteine methyltransferase family protein n=1 Tax=Paenibacillus tritici TaxID=1873425 RepID=A0ABX2DTR6_9BACL|nr:Ada metal-binding domain-containing protein [Paenibacillus tritici]NQX46836.1 methylphosphotriester-DNA--protein-cysteine methyltransferase family protein [Paenibacillus tritici]